MDGRLKKFLEEFKLTDIAADLEDANVLDLGGLQEVIKQTMILEKVVHPVVARARLLNASESLAKQIELSQDSEGPGADSESQEFVQNTEGEPHFSPHPYLRAASIVVEVDSSITADELSETLASKRNLPNQPSPTRISPPSKRAKQSSLFQYLNETAEGKYIIARSNCSAGFDNSVRLKLADIVILKEFGADTEKLIDSRRFIELSREIVETFPDELECDYYVPSHTPAKGKTLQAKGKLYDNYTNFCRNLRKTGLRQSIRKDSGTIQLLPLLPSEGITNLEAKLQFLRTKLYPWPTIENYWQDTSAHRLNSLMNGVPSGNVQDYLDEYGCLKSEKGYTLLELDFRIRYPEADLKISKWNEFSSKVKRELEKKGVTAESDTEILVNFIRLFSVCTVKVPRGKPWRASREEILDGFMLHVEDINNFEREIVRIYDNAKEKGFSVQPFPLIVGKNLSSITSSYIVIEKTTVLVESPLRAFEVAFKTYFALHCEYPLQSQRPWLVVQKALFNIHVPWDRVNINAGTPEVKRLIKILNCD